MIDDDVVGRETLIDQLSDCDYEGVAITGRFGADIDRLIGEVEAADPAFVICDYRLTAQQFATFNGLQVVERLLQRNLPAMLVTTFQEPERMRLRSARSRVPVIEGRDRFRIEDVPKLRDIVVKEMAHAPVASRRPHRVILRVTAVHDKEVEVVVPSWNRDHALVIPRSLLSAEVRKVVAAGDYLLGDVNIGAINEDDLYFLNIDEIVEGIEDFA